MDVGGRNHHLPLVDTQRPVGKEVTGLQSYSQKGVKLGAGMPTQDESSVLLILAIFSIPEEPQMVMG